MRHQLHPSVLHELQTALQGGHERADFRTIAAKAVQSGACRTTLDRVRDRIRAGLVPMSVAERLAIQLQNEG